MSASPLFPPAASARSGDGAPLTVLLVEDGPADAGSPLPPPDDLPGCRFRTERVRDPAAAFAQCEDGRADAVVLAVGASGCGGGDGLGTLARLAAARPETALVAVCASNDRRLCARAQAAGALDVIGRGAASGPLLARSILCAVQRHAALERSRELAGLIAVLPDAAAVIDRTGVVRYVNDAAARIFGLRCGEAVGPLIVTAAALGEPAEIEVERGGRRRTTEVRACPVDWEGQRATLALLSDVTDRKAAAERRRHAQRMEAIGKLAGGVAHDFNNLLTVILGNLELLAARVHDDPDASALANLAFQGAVRGAELTGRLLAFARRRQPDPGLTDVNALLQGLAELLGRTLGEHIEIRLSLAPGLWPILVDPGQLEAAIVNLAVNARDAMPGGGLLEIATRNLALDEDGRPCAETVAVTVCDTGIGMTQEVAGRIFEPFYTTKESGRGTGLGLAMVLEFVEGSGGRISVDSAPDRGATFRLRFPRARDGEFTHLSSGRQSDLAAPSIRPSRVAS